MIGYALKNEIFRWISCHVNVENLFGRFEEIFFDNWEISLLKSEQGFSWISAISLSSGTIIQCVVVKHSRQSVSVKCWVFILMTNSTSAWEYRSLSLLWINYSSCYVVCKTGCRCINQLTDFFIVTAFSSKFSSGEKPMGVEQFEHAGRIIYARKLLRRHQTHLQELSSWKKDSLFFRSRNARYIYIHSFIFFHCEIYQRNVTWSIKDGHDFACENDVTLQTVFANLGYVLKVAFNGLYAVSDLTNSGVIFT